jgi:hypothetical protein
MDFNPPELLPQSRTLKFLEDSELSQPIHDQINLRSGNSEPVILQAVDDSLYISSESGNHDFSSKGVGKHFLYYDYYNGVWHAKKIEGETKQEIKGQVRSLTSSPNVDFFKDDGEEKRRLSPIGVTELTSDGKLSFLPILTEKWNGARMALVTNNIDVIAGETVRSYEEQVYDWGSRLSLSEARQVISEQQQARTLKNLSVIAARRIMRIHHQVKEIPEELIPKVEVGNGNYKVTLMLDNEGWGNITGSDYSDKEGVVGQQVDFGTELVWKPTNQNQGNYSISLINQNGKRRSIQLTENVIVGESKLDKPVTITKSRLRGREEHPSTQDLRRVEINSQKFSNIESLMILFDRVLKPVYLPEGEVGVQNV